MTVSAAITQSKRPSTVNIIPTAGPLRAAISGLGKSIKEDTNRWHKAPEACIALSTSPPNSLAARVKFSIKQ